MSMRLCTPLTRLGDHPMEQELTTDNADHTDGKYLNGNTIRVIRDICG